MNVGDIIRLRHGPACGDVLGLMANQVGVVRTIDATWDRTALLISFPDVDLYTSALREDDFEVIQPGATHPVSATASKARDTA